MTDEFNHRLHRVVVSPWDGEKNKPAGGPNLHVDLGDLIDEIRDYVSEQSAIAKSATETLPVAPQPQEIVKVETIREQLPAEVEKQIEKLEQQTQFVVSKLQNLEGRMTEIAHRVDEVEARPHLSSEDVRQLMDGLNTRFQATIEKLVNGAVGDIRSRLVTIEKTADGAPVSARQSEQLEKLGDIIARTSDYVRSFENAVDERQDDLERKYAEIAEYVTDTNLNMIKVKKWMYNLTAALNIDEKGTA